MSLQFNPREQTQGYNLLEVLITLSILGVISTLAFPSFGHFLADKRLTADTQELSSSLMLARNYAIKHQTNVVICPASNSTQAACLGRPKRHARWEHGWRIFEDTNANGRFDGDDQLLRVARGHERIALMFNLNGKIQFAADGSARSGGFYLCDQLSKSGTHLRLLHTGRIRAALPLAQRRLSRCLSGFS